MAVDELVAACRRGDIEAVQAEVAAGLDLNAPDDVGTVALHCAAYHGHADMIEYLVEAKADVNLPNDDGNVALHYASSPGSKAAASMLLFLGADSTIKNKAGKDPLVWCTNPEVAEVLQNHAAEFKKSRADAAFAVAEAARQAEIASKLAEEIESKDRREQTAFYEKLLEGRMSSFQQEWVDKSRELTTYQPKLREIRNLQNELRNKRDGLNEQLRKAKKAHLARMAELNAELAREEALLKSAMVNSSTKLRDIENLKNRIETLGLDQRVIRGSINQLSKELEGKEVDHKATKDKLDHFRRLTQAYNAQ